MEIDTRKIELNDKEKIEELLEKAHKTKEMLGE